MVTPNPQLAHTIRAELERLGHRAEVAHSALTALQLPAHMHFDAVVLDAVFAGDELADLASRLRRLLRPSTRIALAGS